MDEFYCTCVLHGVASVCEVSIQLVRFFDAWSIEGRGRPRRVVSRFTSVRSALDVRENFPVQHLKFLCLR